MDIGTTILNNRKRLNLTQDALASKLGVSNQAVSKWESAQCCPDIELLPKLADIFEISMDELFGRKPTPIKQRCALPWEDDGALRAVVFIGHQLIKNAENAYEITLTYEGDALDIYCDLNLVCENVNGDIHAGGDVSGTTVYGDIKTGGNAACVIVNGDIKAMGDVTCHEVNGNIESGGSVKLEP